MTTNRFCRYELRTTNVDAARAFYAELLGPEVWGSDVSVGILPEQAAARGAPAHWLGHISVADVETMAGRVVSLGGQPLGPTRRTADGASIAALRDPFGAVLALTSEGAAPRNVVAWHQLQTRDATRALERYTELFGWTATGSVELGAEMLGLGFTEAELAALGPAFGHVEMFAWGTSNESVGSMANTALHPRVHNHWCYYFAVDSLGEALAKVVRNGGDALGTMRTPRGVRVAVCMILREPSSGSKPLAQRPNASRRRSAATDVPSGE